jgi:hypothetical protein
MLTTPDVYAYAGALAGRMGVTWLIDIGCGRADKLLSVRPRFRLFGIDHGENIRWCRAQYEHATWVEWDLTSPEPLPIPDDIALDAVVVCSDVLEHMRDPAPLVRNLARLAERSRALVVSAADSELAQLFAANGASPALAGLTRDNDRDSQKHTVLLTFGQELRPPSRPAPADFSVLAVIPAYNEVDIIDPVIDRLLAQGIRVHLIDNWSTDGTFERVSDLAAGNDRVTIERFPADAAPERCEWASVVRRVEQVAAGDEADWIVFQDADEVRRPPWPGIGLRDGIWAVDRVGYTLVDHTVVNFRPVDFTDYTGMDPLEHFTHFEFGQHPGDFAQLKTWKRSPEVTFAGLGGHRARFDDARVYPLKFTNLHFPIRSQAHGRRKILHDRRQRFSPEDLARGWHGHYDFVGEETTLVWDAARLNPYDPATFESEFLTELVSGVNIPRLQGDLAKYERLMEARLLKPRQG